MQTQTQKDFQSFLRRDPVFYADMAVAGRMPDAELVYAGPDGVLLRIACCQIVSAVSRAAAARLLPLVRPDRDTVLHEPWLLGPLCTAGWRLDMLCKQAAYEGTALVDVPAADGVSLDIRPLSMQDLSFVKAHYHVKLSDAYMAARMQSGMLGAFVDGACAGFIGTHAEGSIGLLEVLPAYRRHGLGRILEAAMINRRLSDGELPYCQVLTVNEASLTLQKRLGMTVSQGNVWWLTPTAQG